jgi:hypothetical protein
MSSHSELMGCVGGSPNVGALNGRYVLDGAMEYGWLWEMYWYGLYMGWAAAWRGLMGC